MRRILLFAGLALALAGAAAAQHPSRERGFKAENVYQFNNVDTVNLFNGNLILTVPLGTEYPVGPGLSYSFVLRYSGNVWRMWESCRYSIREDVEGCSAGVIPQPDNGGLGWRLAFGEVRQPTNGIPNAHGSVHEYRSPDGAVHKFYRTLHEPECNSTVTSNCDVGISGVAYTRDGTYIRMRQVGDRAYLEFPSGQRQRYDRIPDTTKWRLKYIYNTFSTFDSNGNPNKNYVEFNYVPSATSGVDDTWEIRDSHGRLHRVIFEEDPRVTEETDLVKTVELEAFRGSASSRQTATYSFNYHPWIEIRKPCDVESGPLGARPSFLASVTLPSQEQWQFEYSRPETQCSFDSGAMTQATLPTGGKIAWEYLNYAFSTAPASVGVKLRQLIDGTAPVQKTKYTPGADASSNSYTAVEPQKLTAAGQWVTDSKSLHYQMRESGAEFGLPYRKTGPDDSGRRLSSETYVCSDTACETTPVRSHWVRYEMDAMQNPCVSVEDACRSERNRRVVSEKTVYVDAGQTAFTDYSSFDGLGHYRTTTWSGKTGSNLWGADRTSTTNYNPDRGTYAVSGDTRLPGFNMLPTTSEWLINLSKTSTTSEGGTTAKVETCFAEDGFLLRRRVLSGSAPGANDLLTVYERDPATSFVKTEHHLGGDKHQLDTTTDTCTADVPAHNAFTYRLDHTYSNGALATTRYHDGVGLYPFYASRAIIDVSGLPAASFDPSEVRTDYKYDAMGRLTEVKPEGIDATTYTYVPLSGTTPASVTAATGTGTLSLSESYEFDAFGRLRRTRKKMPGEAVSLSEITYDSVGRKGSVSEPTYAATASTNVTAYSDYDPFGRARKVTRPDAAETTFSFLGEGKVTRTSKVATTATGQTSVSTVEEFDRYRRLVKVIEDSAASAVATTYSYDVADRLVQVIQGTQQRTFTYDGRGVLKSETHPESGQTSYQYDARAHVVEKVTPVATLTYAYDKAERLRAVSDAGGVIKKFSYDRPNSGSDKSLAKLEWAERHHRATPLGDAVVKETFWYAGVGGRLSQKKTEITGNVGGQSFTDTYQYDSLGQLVNVTYPTCRECATTPPARTVTTTYEHGLPVTIAGSAGANVTYANGITYHPNGLLDTLRHINVTGSNGPQYKQTLNQGMARPGGITVTAFCDNLRITSIPAAQEVDSGQPANVSVAAEGATRYEWYEEGSSTPIAGQTTNTLSVAVSVEKRFWVRIFNDACSIDSAMITVRIRNCAAASAAITAPSTVTAGTVYNASVPGAGTYTWTITNGTIVSGNGTNAITFRAACGAGSVSLGVRVTSGCGAISEESRSIPVVGSTATLSVHGSSTIPAGGSAELRLTLTGQGPFTVTWSDETAPITVQTASTITKVVSPPATRTYTATVTDGQGCSVPVAGQAVITVFTCPAPATPVISSSAVSAGGTGTAWVDSIPGATYFWTVNGGTINGSHRLSTVQFTANCSGVVNVKVRITNDCGGLAETDKSIASFPTPSAQVAGSANITRGESTTISAVMTGTAPWTVQWTDQSSTMLMWEGNRVVAPLTTTTYQVTSVVDANGCAVDPQNITGAAVVTVSEPPPATPSGLIATATTTTRVDVSWSSPDTDVQFEVYRNGQLIATTTAQSLEDTVLPSKSYYYAVRGVRAGVAGGWSNKDLATTVAFATIVARTTTVSDEHFLQLQQAVNYARQAVGLPDATYTAGVGPKLTVYKQHIYDLRNALNAACSVLNIVPSYERADLTKATIKAKDVTEIQDILK
jgi:YD repeat-containing protein